MKVILNYSPLPSVSLFYENLQNYRIFYSVVQFQGQFRRERRELRTALRRRIHFRKDGVRQEIGDGGAGVGGDGVGVTSDVAGGAEGSSQPSRSAHRTFPFDDFQPLPV